MQITHSGAGLVLAFPRMQFHVITLFPDFIRSLEQYSVIGRAIGEGRVQVVPHDLRQYGLGKYRQVDDAPFGGGAGMLLRPEPIVACIEDLRAQGISFPVVAFGAAGRTLSQTRVERFAQRDGLILLCGHYEGIDQRVIDGWVDEELSIGRYVLSGGEVPALVVIDAVSRLLPGVLGKAESHAEESFSAKLDRRREYPQYTRPAEFRGMRVPDVLLSGHHGKVATWREEQRR